MSTSATGLFLGIISGTSVDAIDAVLVEFNPEPRVLAHSARRYPEPLRREILELGLGSGDTSVQTMGRLDVAIAREFSWAALSMLETADVPASAVRAIGSHGQTVWHAPTGATPFTTQLGDPNVIAEMTGINVVADFRRRDVAAGGQGAPLVPAFHAAVMHNDRENRAILNLGGIANLTLLPCRGPVRGFDTGPANTLLDLWVERHQSRQFDQDGAFAATGKCDAALLDQLLSDPYFAMKAPKSTGRDYFNMSWLQKRLDRRSDLQAQDVQATLMVLTVRTVAMALQSEAPETESVIVCGGGARNGGLLNALAAELPGARISTSDEHGLPSDYMEAMAFAWLARETLNHRPGNLPAVTGATGLRILGGIFQA